MGRPTTCGCDVCEKCQRRKYMRDWYRTTHRSYAKPEVRRAYENRRYNENGEYWMKHRARMAIAQRVRRGVVTRGPCALCGDHDTVAHHNDYSRPLDATWLCAPCHNMVHGPLPTGEVP